MWQELIDVLKVNMCDEIITMIMIDRFHENLLMWWQFFNAMEIYQSDKNGMKIYQNNENSSVWWKYLLSLVRWRFIKVMKT